MYYVYCYEYNYIMFNRLHKFMGGLVEQDKTNYNKHKKNNI